MRTRIAVPRHLWCRIQPSKAALSVTPLAFAIELEKTNLKVNVVYPGHFATDLNDYREATARSSRCKASREDGSDRT